MTLVQRHPTEFIKHELTFDQFFAHPGSRIRRLSLGLFKRWRHTLCDLITWFKITALWDQPAPEDIWKVRLSLELLETCFLQAYEHFKILNQSVSAQLHLEQGRFLADNLLHDVEKALVKEDNDLTKE